MPGPIDEARDEQGKWTAGPHAILTAENPHGAALGSDENAKRNAGLKAELERRGYHPIKATGSYVDEHTGQRLYEHPFVVPGMPPAEAEELGKKFGQNSVVTQEGLHDLKTGTLYPSSGVNEVGPDAPAYTEVGGHRYSHDIKFDIPQTKEDQAFAKALTAHIAAHPEFNKPDEAAQYMAEEEMRDFPSGS